MSITIIYEQDEEEEELSQMLLEQATPEKLAALRERHVKMYRRRLDSGSGAVNEHETLVLLRLWEGMAGKTAAQLSETERAEVLDALAAGE